jgi:hypothetical protein
VQRHALVRRVQRAPARPRLAVDGGARRDEGGDVGDRVAHAPAAAVAPLELKGLVEVARAGRVERHEPHVAQVRARAPVVARAALGRGARLGEHLVGEPLGDVELPADLREAGAHVVDGRGRGRAQAAGH